MIFTYLGIILEIVRSKKILKRKVLREKFQDSRKGSLKNPMKKSYEKKCAKKIENMRGKKSIIWLEKSEYIHHKSLIKCMKQGS